MILKLIIVWLALQIPLGALIGTFLQSGMAQSWRQDEAEPGVAAPVFISERAYALPLPPLAALHREMPVIEHAPT
jgi:hypothetical protein